MILGLSGLQAGIILAPPRGARLRKRAHYAQDRHPTQYARGAAGISSLLNDIDIIEDATPGALARLVEMHALYYARMWRVALELRP